MRTTTSDFWRQIFWIWMTVVVAVLEAEIAQRWLGVL
jgi:hypothetical protein